MKYINTLNLLVYKGYGILKTMEPRERLKSIRQTLNVNQKIFAKGIFISTSYYAGIETGHRQINERILDLLDTVYNVNKAWVLTGQGEMFNNAPPDMQLEELIDIFKRLNKHFQNYILDQIRNLEKIQENEPSQEQIAGSR